MVNGDEEYNFEIATAISGDIYVDYEKNKESVDEILRITELCEKEEMEWSVGDDKVNDILFELEK